MMKSLAIAAIAGAVCTSSAFGGFVAHFSNGRQIWTSTNSGGSFTNSGAVTSKSGGSGQSLNNIGIVGLGYHAGSDTYYATASDNWLYSVSGLGTANVSITGVANMLGHTISFDFFGDRMLAVRGNDLIEIADIINAPTTVSVVNTNTGVNGIPATARIGNDYYGTTADGRFFQINESGGVSNIGNTLQANTIANGGPGYGQATMAGGASDNGQSFYASLGYSNGIVRFGSIDIDDAEFHLSSETNVGSAAGQMGMVITVIPLPHAGGMAMAGLLGIFAIRRRVRL